VDGKYVYVSTCGSVFSGFHWEEISLDFI
jgi:hypothetical protein